MDDESEIMTPEQDKMMTIIILIGWAVGLVAGGWLIYTH